MDPNCVKGKSLEPNLCAKQTYPKAYARKKSRLDPNLCAKEKSLDPKNSGELKRNASKFDVLMIVGYTPNRSSLLKITWGGFLTSIYLITGHFV